MMTQALVSCLCFYLQTNLSFCAALQKTFEKVIEVELFLLSNENDRQFSSVMKTTSRKVMDTIFWQRRQSLFSSNLMIK
jgi:hypothetical protein